MIFPQLFCKHKWVDLSKTVKEETIYVKNIVGDGYNNTGITEEKTTHIIVCEKCGKIKTLKY